MRSRRRSKNALSNSPAGALLGATPAGGIGVNKAPHGLLGVAAKVREAQRTVWPLGFAVAATLVTAIPAALAATTGHIQAQAASAIILAALIGLILLLTASFFVAGKNPNIRTAARNGCCRLWCVRPECSRCLVSGPM
jgi:hypothetical protein